VSVCHRHLHQYFPDHQNFHCDVCLLLLITPSQLSPVSCCFCFIIWQSCVFGGCARRSHCLHTLLLRLCSQMLDPPHCLHTLLWRLCSQMLDPPHCLHTLLWRLCSQMLDPPHCLHTLQGFGGCARRCSTRRNACPRFLCGSARRCSTRRIACTRLLWRFLALPDTHTCANTPCCNVYSCIICSLSGLLASPSFYIIVFLSKYRTKLSKPPEYPLDIPRIP
jgi:hypothetical protein